MSRTKKRIDETGTDDRGKHTFARHEGELVRAWVLAMTLRQRRELAAAEKLLFKRVTPATESRHQIAVCVLGWLEGMLRAGTRSLDTLDWAEAWTHVTTVERFQGQDAKPRHDQPSIPGM